MAGQFRGVQARILEVQEKAIFVHCFNHSLNLALQDTITKNQFFRNLLSNVHEIGTIMKGSPKRNAEFEKLLGKSNSIKPRPLCPSRWTVRVRAIDGILSGYDTVLEFFENLSGSDDKVATKAAGIYSQLEKGEFYMGLIMAKKLFSLGESLAKVLQAPAATISGAIEAATFTIKRLLALKSEETFEEMWVDFGVKLNEYSLHEPQAPRIRNRPKRFDKVDDSPSFDSAKSWLQHAFFQAIDFMCEEIGRRFDQSGLSMYDKMESALLKCASGRSDDLTTVCDFYGWDSEKLLSEVSVLRNVHNTAWTTTSEIVHIYKGLKQEVKILFPTLQNYLKHLLVVPCSSAGAERSFSWLRRIKSYLRSTMGQARLNHCCLINCYGDDIVDQLDLAEMMLEFVRVSNREATFGKI
ncbi:unnamed protein product [Orchesella dallaii]|uniref:HAT C-terminal dimerisation domain-containing protein n=1 Tax=Orchesella dallaii TaxID=48710 RepID=A0ABP1RQF8_9HEXA